jgi:anti-sigma regulatory factor (Ser/Thr protein kinase)
MTSGEPPLRNVRSAGPGPQTLDVDEPFDQGSLYRLRATLAAHASAVGATDGQIDLLLIVAGELVVNAIRHGGGTGRLRLWHHRDMLYCQVSDQGPGIADTGVGTSLPNPYRSEGRGIWICRSLARDLRFGAGAGGLGATVTAAIPRP